MMRALYLNQHFDLLASFKGTGWIGEFVIFANSAATSTRSLFELPLSLKKYLRTCWRFSWIDQFIMLFEFQNHAVSFTNGPKAQKAINVIMGLEAVI